MAYSQQYINTYLAGNLKYSSQTHDILPINAVYTTACSMLDTLSLMNSCPSLTHNNLMNTYHLKQRHDRRREKRYMYVAVTYTSSCINCNKNSPTKPKTYRGREKRYFITSLYIKQFNENSPAKP